MQRLKNRTALPIPREMGPMAEGSTRAFAGHDEWLLDESLGETFPASDPISPAVPAGGAPGSKRADPAERKRMMSR